MTEYEHHERRAWVGLAVLLLPVLLISMSVTIMNFAVPSLSRELRPSGAELLWIVDIYTFVLAGLLIPMGALGDRIGRRRLLLLGAAAFGLASATAALAGEPGVLIAARALLGVGGATLMPTTLALIRTMFPDPRRRRNAIAVWTAGFVGGTAIGPLAGGALLEHFWWGSVFLVNVPVMVLLLVAGPSLLPESRNPDPGPFDLPGALLALTVLLTAIYGIKRLAEHGIGSLGVGAVLAAVVLAVVFLNRQRRHPDGLVDLGLFRRPGFAVALLAVTVGVFSMVGLMFFVSQYLQLVQGMRPIVAGLWILPMVVMTAGGSGLSVALLARWRQGTVVVAALLSGAAGMLVLTQLTVTASMITVVIGVGLVGAGTGAIAAVCTDLVVASAPPERAGSAASLSEAAGELGGALGVAILGTIGMHGYRAGVAEHAPEEAPEAVVRTVEESLGGAVAIAERLPGYAGSELLRHAFQAFTTGMGRAVACATVVLMVTAAMVAVAFLRRGRPTAGSDRTAGAGRSSSG